MRRIIMLSSLSLSLLGGVASASPFSEDRREIAHDRAEVAHDRRELAHDRRELVRDEVRYRSARFRPAARQERFEHRRGFSFVRGEWTWNGYEWVWIPGHYVRVRGW